MTIIFDDSDAVEGGEIQLTPEGRYEVEIIEAEAKRSKKVPHDPMLTIVVKVLGQSYEYTDRETGQIEQRPVVVYDNLMMAGRGAGMGAAKSKAFGRELVKGTPVEEHDYIGLRAMAYLKHETYQGKTRLKVDSYQGEYCGYDPVGTPSPASTKAEDTDFDDIPFVWALWLLPLLGMAVA